MCSILENSSLPQRHKVRKEIRDHIDYDHEKGLAEKPARPLIIYVLLLAYPVLRNPAEMPLMVAART